jgi:hypothetical protein
MCIVLGRMMNHSSNKEDLWLEGLPNPEPRQGCGISCRPWKKQFAREQSRYAEADFHLKSSCGSPVHGNTDQDRHLIGWRQKKESSRLSESVRRAFALFRPRYEISEEEILTPSPSIVSFDLTY